MLEAEIKALKKLVSSPENFLSAQNEKAEKFRELLKSLYDLNHKVSEGPPRNVLPNLILQNMDEEQIWQQLELNNEEQVTSNIQGVSTLLSLDEQKLYLPYTRKDEKSEESNDEEDEEMEVDDDEEQESDEDEDENSQEVPKLADSKKKSIVDDQFFKLSEMEAFLELEDKKAMGKIKLSDDGIDYFQDFESDSDDEDEKNLKYKDYFDNEDGEDQEDEEDQENGEDEEEQDDEMEAEEEEEKSNFDKRQEKLRKTIEKLEEKALEGKSWQMKGEATSTSRPQNSLLEEHLEFDAATRPAPIITQQTTMLLEDIIKQRVKDRAFDDVERKLKPVQSAPEYRKELILNQEKSKESLAQIYEKEFLKEKAKLDPVGEEKEDEPASHKEIRKTLSGLFAKLDALSNYHFTPKPAAPEVRIITNTPAIDMEEVAPVSVSNAHLLAPEEVKKPFRGDVIASAEMTKTDKLRSRRQKKAKQREHAKVKGQKDKFKAKKEASNDQEKARLMKAVLKSKNVEAMRIGKIGSIKTSSAFFSMLNEQQQAAGATGKKQKSKAKKQPTGISARFVKL